MQQDVEQHMAKLLWVRYACFKTGERIDFEFDGVKRACVGEKQGWDEDVEVSSFNL